MPQDCTFLLPQAQVTRRLGEALGEMLPAGSVLLLDGNLGSGKTTLTQGIGAGLGITDTIVSPTFTLICEYLDGRIPLYHLDLYRLEPAAVEQLYLETYWEGWEKEPGIMAIEWPERLVHRPDRYLHLTLQFHPFTAQSTADDPAPGRSAILRTVGDWTLDWVKIQQMLADCSVKLGEATGEED